MINAVATRINTPESFSLQDVEKSLAGLLTQHESSDREADMEGLQQIDCYTPSEQRMEEEEFENLTAMQQTGRKMQPADKKVQAVGNKDGKKKVMEEIVNTLKDFFKAPSNIYLHKKLNDAAADGDLEKASKMNEKKADYNMPQASPGGEKTVRR